MGTLKSDIFLNPFQEAPRMKKLGWYGVTFFLIEGVFLLITPFIIYAFN